jgi:hypothetical protein
MHKPPRKNDDIWEGHHDIAGADVPAAVAYDRGFDINRLFVAVCDA